MKKYALAVLMLLLKTPAMAAATPWQSIQHPVSGAPQSIGSFANGCIIGAQQLPPDAADYQVMRPDQRRYFGHPDLIRFIQRFSASVAAEDNGEVLIGDMGMAAGAVSVAVMPATRPVWMWISGFSYLPVAGRHNNSCIRNLLTWSVPMANIS
ncbi:Penicillin-insensitive murein endopeptidase precursor [Tatumella ptyseos]|uniref:Penicillin-insensitive murein endopeptidase n=1 Tax=Tatumella ptyseos TaxID=82987 RepID=A0A2X5NQL5_9GAMM|nr:Penicillin-insensitive murein endopeptidase precursor [Tatumella ptyseos]